MARQQAALPNPQTHGFGLLASTAQVEDSVVGIYEGRSFSNKRTAKGLQKVPGSVGHVERFQIARDSDRITVAGRSLDPDSLDMYSRWKGTLWKIDEHGTLYFGIELTIIGTHREFGTLVVTVDDGRAEALYYSGEPNTPFVYKINASKVALAPTPLAPRPA